MTDLEINKALALAIGWPEHLIKIDRGYSSEIKTFVCTDVGTLTKLAQWRVFDYRDPAVIWPIAERFDCFPTKSVSFGWRSCVRSYHEYASTPQKAVALAVIGAKS